MFAQIVRNYYEVLSLKKKFIILLLIGFLLGACSPQKEISQTAEEQLGISVSVLPQAYFVERIAGELALVNVMVGRVMTRIHTNLHQTKCDYWMRRIFT